MRHSGSPSLSSASTVGALPFTAASASGVTPWSVAALDVGACDNQRADRVRVVPVRGPVKGGSGAVALGAVHVGVLFEERLECDAIACFRRVGHSPIRRRRREARGERQRQCQDSGSMYLHVRASYGKLRATICPPCSVNATYCLPPARYGMGVPSGEAGSATSPSVAPVFLSYAINFAPVSEPPTAGISPYNSNVFVDQRPAR
jgi:hypothetical protein